MGGSRPKFDRMLHVGERMESSTYTYNCWNRGVTPTTPPNQDIYHQKKTVVNTTDDIPFFEMLKDMDLIE